MPNVILPNLGIELPDVGSDQDTWGDILNADLEILDLAVQYDAIAKTLGAADVTLTDAEAASAVINLTGTLTANVNLIVPVSPVRLYLVNNGTTGAFTVTVKTPLGTGVTVLQGANSLVYSDGTNIIQGATSVNGSFAVSGALSAGSVSTASATITGGSVNSTPVGNTTPSSGAFTTLSASGATTLNGEVTLGDAAADAITVTGTATFAQATQFPDGTAALPAITNTGDTNTGRFFPAEDVIAESTGGVERARITSTGNMLVGAASQIDASNRVEITGGQIGHFSNQFNTYPGSGNPYEIINRSVGPLDLYVSGVLRPVRITSAGYFKASNTGVYGSVAGDFHEVRSNQNNSVLESETTNIDAGARAYVSKLPNGASGVHHLGLLNGVTVYQVLANGNVQNTNNSYGAISDAKLKNLISPAPSYWERYKLIEWVKYILKNDPTNQEQLGVIAQQVRGIFPGLIEEAPDMHEVTKTREVTKTVLVTTTETQNVTSTEIKLVNGKYVQVTTVTPTEVQVPVIDEFPVYDESGQPVMQLVSPAVEAQDAVLDDEGNEIQPAVAAQDAVYAPLMHKVPRMQTITETETYTEMEPTGTVTLSVKYSILGHISDVVLQEAMARIEALEAR